MKNEKTENFAWQKYRNLLHGKGQERPIKFEVFHHEKGVPVYLNGTKQAGYLKSETIVRFADTGQPCFVRLQFQWPAVQSGVSKEHHFYFLTWPGGGTVAFTKDEISKENAKSQVEIVARKLAKPSILRKIPCWFCVNIFEGGNEITNLREQFYFPGVPAGIASSDAEKQVVWLAGFVADWLHREQQQKREMAQAQQKEQLQKFPPLNPAKDYGKPDFDHYANQQQVLVKLLSAKWPRLTKAAAEFRNAKTADEKADKQKAVWLGYIADYKALFKKLPEVKDKDLSDMMQTDKWHDHYVQLMNEAINAVSEEDKRDWRLATGWIEKNYYRMNERELEAAFARDWPDIRHQKGNTLAKRARGLGLVSYLTRGPKK